MRVRLALFLIVFVCTVSVSYAQETESEAQASEALSQYMDTANLLRATLESVKNSRSESLLLTPEAVRRRIRFLPSGTTYEQRLVDDFIHVMEGSGHYAWAYDFKIFSEEIDLLESILSSGPPYSITFYDHALFSYRKALGVAEYSATYLPNDLKRMRRWYSSRAEDDKLPPTERLQSDLTHSIMYAYNLQLMEKMGKILPLLTQTKKKLVQVKSEVQFTEQELRALQSDIKGKVDALHAKSSGDTAVAEFSRQLEIDYLQLMGKYLEARYNVLNGNLDSKSMVELLEDINRVMEYCRVDIDHLRDLQGRYAKNLEDKKRQETMLELTRLSAELLPRLFFILEQTREEIYERTGSWLAVEKALHYLSTSTLAIAHTEVVGGSGYSITIGKFLFIILAVGASFLGSRWLSRILQKVLFAPLTKNKTAAHLSQQLLFYFLLLISVVIIFYWFDIPLTSLSFLGGALALGFGLASQNLFSNMISGLLLATTRPFKAGDLILFEKNIVEVLEVGERVTHLRASDGTDIFVQNKAFIENTVINMTYREHSILQVEVHVKVPYTEDHKGVKERLLIVASANTDVLPDPKPYVLINNIADNAMGFTLCVWIDLRKSSKLLMVSALREAILDDFGRKGINLSTPDMAIVAGGDILGNAGSKKIVAGSRSAG